MKKFKVKDQYMRYIGMFTIEEFVYYIDLIDRDKLFVNYYLYFGNVMQPITITQADRVYPSKIEEMLYNIIKEVALHVDKDLIESDEKIKQSDFMDSYNITLLLMDDNKNIYSELHKGMSLSDYEVLYGNISDMIISMNMSLVKL